MSDRYLAAIVMREDCREARRVGPVARRHGLHIALEADDLVIAAPREAWTQSTERSASAVVGNLYFRTGPCDSLDGSNESTASLTSCLARRALGDECWGSFLAIHLDRQDDALIVHRSAFGSINAYFTLLGGMLAISSDARILAELIGARAIDWDVMARQLLWDDLAESRTCVAGISEIRCGEVLRWKRGESPSTAAHWNPWNFTANDRVIAERKEASARLHHDIFEYIGKRLADLDGAILDLSGGLDSSIIAAVTAQSGVSLCPVNLFSAATEGDERHYARTTANRLGLRLIEYCPDPDRVDIVRCGSPQLPRPHARSFVQEIDRLTLFAAPEARAFVNGGGGDSVFCHLQSSGPAADVLGACGFGPAYFRVVHEVARAAQCGTWEVLRKSLIKARRSHAGLEARRDTSFLARPWSANEVLHRPPWPMPPAVTPPGKREHVLGLYNSCFNMNGFGRSRLLKPVFPLLSQPLVETCLAIPSWAWLGEGRNRLLVRRAMASYLPDEVVWRTSKGGLGHLQREIFRRNRDLMREMLLSGRLQRQGLLDRPAIEDHLKPHSALKSDKYGRLLRLCDFEAWISCWD
ncbi:asparagine synthase C-terminal domain-containing protein [Novosphingobium album (ex Liu et al. 2023)]|uniref:asparagine synthase (glutamine-hydrolyzing) n=1 Tax=Novosphingobium album (ex Liu et al. 2023) TaxID=3031130 RepID=A0ABT5WQH3_9SPHN|nr:asparagine synthase C-terminal domain-containing protein [Novosphingobium album (ex Liu et al. 2023)]MDE8652263.1 asparagine synthase C-terminal domain-containing protein [Novosphingobium album (ex Liu et al. 2023)]